MKKPIQLLVSILLLLGVLNTASMADVDEIGQKYYIIFMRDHTGMKGSSFTKLQTQLEWKELFDNDGEQFIEVYSKKFPGLKEFLISEDFQKYRIDIRNFFIEFAKDAMGVAAGC
ncbi:MAG: hypothetical protein ACK5LP_07530 [Campylobacteraceae bacterium]